MAKPGKQRVRHWKRKQRGFQVWAGHGGALCLTDFARIVVKACHKCCALIMSLGRFFVAAFSRLAQAGGDTLGQMIGDAVSSVRRWSLRLAGTSTGKPKTHHRARMGRANCCEPEPDPQDGNRAGVGLRGVQNNKPVPHAHRFANPSRERSDAQLAPKTRATEQCTAGIEIIHQAEDQICILAEGRDKKNELPEGAWLSDALEQCEISDDFAKRISQGRQVNLQEDLRRLQEFYREGILIGMHGDLVYPEQEPPERELGKETRKPERKRIRVAAKSDGPNTPVKVSLLRETVWWSICDSFHSLRRGERRRRKRRGKTRHSATCSPRVECAESRMLLSANPLAIEAAEIAPVISYVPQNDADRFHDGTVQDSKIWKEIQETKLGDFTFSISFNPAPNIALELHPVLFAHNIQARQDGPTPPSGFIVRLDPEGFPRFLAMVNGKWEIAKLSERPNMGETNIFVMQKEDKEVSFWLNGKDAGGITLSSPDITQCSQYASRIGALELGAKPGRSAYLAAPFKGSIYRMDAYVGTLTDEQFQAVLAGEVPRAEEEEAKEAPAASGSADPAGSGEASEAKVPSPDSSWRPASKAEQTFDGAESVIWEAMQNKKLEDFTIIIEFNPDTDINIQKHPALFAHVNQPRTYGDMPASGFTISLNKERMPVFYAIQDAGRVQNMVAGNTAVPLGEASSLTIRKHGAKISFLLDGKDAGGGTLPSPTIVQLPQYQPRIGAFRFEGKTPGSTYVASFFKGDIFSIDVHARFLTDEQLQAVLAGRVAEAEKEEADNPPAIEAAEIASVISYVPETDADRFYDGTVQDSQTWKDIQEKKLDDFTFSIRFNPAPNIALELHPVLFAHNIQARQDGPTPPSGFIVRLDPEGFMRFYAMANGKWEIAKLSERPNMGETNIFVMQKEGKKVSFWLNGKDAGGITLSSPDITQSSQYASRIGALELGAKPGTSAYLAAPFRGSVDRMDAYVGTLTEEQFQAVLAGEVARGENEKTEETSSASGSTPVAAATEDSEANLPSLLQLPSDGRFYAWETASEQQQVFDGTTYRALGRTALPNGLTAVALIRTTSNDADSAYAGNAALNLLGDSTNSVYLGFGIHGGVLRYNHHVNGWKHLDGNTPINDGEWHLVGVEHNPATKMVRLYVDGVLDVEASIGYDALHAGIDLIGAGYSGSSHAGDNFVGDLKGIAAFGRTFSDAERNVIMCGGTQKATEEDGSSFMATDTAGAAVSFPTPLYAMPASLEQSNSVIDTHINTDELTGRTVFAFHLHIAERGRAALFSGYVGGNANRWDFEFDTNGNGRIVFYEHGGVRGVSSQRQFAVGDEVDVQLVYDDDGNRLRLYLDGVLDTEAEVTQSLRSGVGLYVNGRGPAGGGGLENGNPLSEMAIYTGLSAEEVNAVLHGDAHDGAAVDGQQSSGEIDADETSDDSASAAVPLPTALYVMPESLEQSSGVIDTHINTDELTSRTVFAFHLHITERGRAALFSGYVGGNANRWDFEFDTNGNGRIVFYEHGGVRGVSSQRQFAVGDEVDVQLVYDDDANQLRLYLDGELDTTAKVTQSLRSGVVLHMNGRGPQGGGGLDNKNPISHAQIYTNLSQEEVQAVLALEAQTTPTPHASVETIPVSSVLHLNDGEPRSYRGNHGGEIEFENGSFQEQTFSVWGIIRRGNVGPEAANQDVLLSLGQQGQGSEGLAGAIFGFRWNKAHAYIAVNDTFVGILSKKEFTDTDRNYEFVCTVDGGTHKVKLYVDGEELQTVIYMNDQMIDGDTLLGPIDYTSRGTTKSLEGNVYGHKSGRPLVDAKVDIRASAVLSIVLSPAQVTAMYDGDGLKAIIAEENASSLAATDATVQQEETPQNQEENDAADGEQETRPTAATIDPTLPLDALVPSQMEKLDAEYERLTGSIQGLVEELAAQSEPQKLAELKAAYLVATADLAEWARDKRDLSHQIDVLSSPNIQSEDVAFTGTQEKAHEVRVESDMFGGSYDIIAWAGAAEKTRLTPSGNDDDMRSLTTSGALVSIDFRDLYRKATGFTMQVGDFVLAGSLEAGFRIAEELGLSYQLHGPADVFYGTGEIHWYQSNNGWYFLGNNWRDGTYDLVWYTNTDKRIHVPGYFFRHPEELKPLGKVTVTAHVFRGSTQIATVRADENGMVSFDDSEGITAVVLQDSHPDYLDSYTIADFSVRGDVHAASIPAPAVSPMTNPTLGSEAYDFLPFAPKTQTELISIAHGLGLTVWDSTHDYPHAGISYVIQHQTGKYQQFKLKSLGGGGGSIEKVVYFNEHGVFDLPEDMYELYGSSTVVIAPGAPRYLALQTNGSGKVTVHPGLLGAKPEDAMPELRAEIYADILRVGTTFENVGVQDVTIWDRPPERSEILSPGGTYGVRAHITNPGTLSTQVTVQLVAGHSGTDARNVSEPISLKLAGNQTKELVTNVTIPGGEGRPFVQIAAVLPDGRSSTETNSGRSPKERRSYSDRDLERLARVNTKVIAAIEAQGDPRIVALFDNPTATVTALHKQNEALAQLQQQILVTGAPIDREALERTLSEAAGRKKPEEMEAREMKERLEEQGLALHEQMEEVESALIARGVVVSYKAPESLTGAYRDFFDRLPIAAQRAFLAVYENGDHYPNTTPASANELIVGRFLVENAGSETALDVGNAYAEHPEEVAAFCEVAVQTYALAPIQLAGKDIDSVPDVDRTGRGQFEWASLFRWVEDAPFLNDQLPSKTAAGAILTAAQPLHNNTPITTKFSSIEINSNEDNTRAAVNTYLAGQTNPMTAFSEEAFNTVKQSILEQFGFILPAHVSTELLNAINIDHYEFRQMVVLLQQGHNYESAFVSVKPVSVSMPRVNAPQFGAGLLSAVLQTAVVKVHDAITGLQPLNSAFELNLAKGSAAGGLAFALLGNPKASALTGYALLAATLWLRVPNNNDISYVIIDHEHGNALLTSARPEAVCATLQDNSGNALADLEQIHQRTLDYYADLFERGIISSDQLGSLSQSASTFFAPYVCSLSTAENPERRQRENAILSQVKQYFPLENVDQLRWDLGSGFHDGAGGAHAVDLNRGYGNTDLGDKVFAVAAGTITDVQAGWGAVTITHEGPDDGLAWTSQYGHLLIAETDSGNVYNLLDVAGNTIKQIVVGETSVRPGEHFAAVGDTGTVYAHLHFKIAYGGESIDMRRLLAGSEENGGLEILVTATDAGPDGNPLTDDGKTLNVQWDGDLHSWVAETDGLRIIFDRSVQFSEDNDDGTTPAYWREWEDGKDVSEMQMYTWWQ